MPPAEKERAASRSSLFSLHNSSAFAPTTQTVQQQDTHMLPCFHTHNQDAIMRALYGISVQHAQCCRDIRICEGRLSVLVRDMDQT